jgi:arylsulfatase A-like enzyme
MSEKPNIIVIYTDQQRYDTLHCCGNPLIQTPNLDQLASEGCLFHQHHVTTPVCVPSRVSFFTGRYAHSTGSYNNSRLMEPDETDFVSRFRNAGYRTVLLGKDHCFGRKRVREAFDHVEDAGHCRISPALSPRSGDIQALRSDKMQVAMAEDPIPADDNITGALFGGAIGCVRQHAQPLFMWLSIPDPHPPYMVCEPYAGLYRNQEIPPPSWREGEMADKPFRQRLVVEWDRLGKEYPDDSILELKRKYWGMVTYIDTEVGKLLAALEETGQADNTIVVFTSDHGDYMGDHRMIRKGPHLYEALTRVPLIVRWPARIRPKETQALVANIDVLPTLAELAGIPSFSGVEGQSFANVLLDESVHTHRTAIFMEHGDPGIALQEAELSQEQYGRLCDSASHHLCPEISRGETKGVLLGHWKYCITSGDVAELYDLDSDPDELVNRAADPAFHDIVKACHTRLSQWISEGKACP